MTSQVSGRILVVDDEEAMRWALKKALENKGFDVVTLATGEEAVREAARKRFSLILMDIKMPGINGIEALQRIRNVRPNQIVVLMTAYGTMRTAIDAMKEGAFDYVTKPFNFNEIFAIIEKALAVGQYSEGVSYLSAELVERPVYGNVIGRSPAMQALYRLMGQVAGSEVTLLIRGASGTGKELIARAIHHYSNRSEKPFLVVNIAAIPGNLLESELFGHEKGAFTGAVNTAIGKFELAHGGTLFLDEIGDMDLVCQSKLLRVLQEREFYRVGGTQPIRVDVRIIAATNKDIDVAQQKGQFRSDLYHRLTGMPIDVPPLRDRREDVPLLNDYFLSKFEVELNIQRKYLSREVIEILTRYAWPGNVRELENALKRAMVLAPTSIILPEHLPSEIVESTLQHAPALERLDGRVREMVRGYVGALGPEEKGDLYNHLVQRLEKPLIEEALRRAGMNKKQAADLIGINRNTLNKKIKELNIHVPPSRAAEGRDARPQAEDEASEEPRAD